MRLFLVVGAACFAGIAAAEGMDSSLRPLPNPIYTAAVTEPVGLVKVGLAEMTSPRPKARPAGLAAGKGKQEATVSAKGSVCGVAAIKGAAIAPIKGKVKGCGLADGVRVTSVSGVRLSQSITVDCPTAKALNTWVRDVAQPEFGGSLAELAIAGHYACRPRNNKKGAKISEHGRGRAVDISGFVMAGGKTFTVARNFNKTLRRVHKGACGIFATTLGPGSDGFHEDHLHFDTAAHRSGTYCR